MMEGGEARREEEVNQEGGEGRGKGREKRKEKGGGRAMGERGRKE